MASTMGSSRNRPAGLQGAAQVIGQGADIDPQVHQRRDGADRPEGVPVERVALHERGADLPALAERMMHAARSRLARLWKEERW